MTLEEIFRAAAKQGRLSRFSVLHTEQGWQANAVSEHDSKAFHVSIDADPIEAIRRAFDIKKPKKAENKDFDFG